MTNEKIPERVWLTVFTDDKEPRFTMLEWQSPVVRDTQPGDYVATRPHHKVEYVPASVLATKVKEEREAERKRTLTIIQQMPATAAGADAFRKRVIEEMYRVAALTEKKEDRSEDEHHCYNKGGAL